MPKSTSTPQPQPSPRDRAVQRAAQAADTHQTRPDTATLYDLRSTVQAALDLGATFADIRAARTTAVSA
ncbi:MAG: hypothetical protein HOV70_23665 [Streptomyces sp.]|nr:hypothetical protein [Streptomyces sp.]